MKIHFEKANETHQSLIFDWLEEPHMQEFWDNSQDHKDDILNFLQGKKQHYFYGTTQYWIGFIDNVPFCFILSDIFQLDQDLSDVHRANMSPHGHTIGIDFGIGNTKYLGQGLAAPTLNAFVLFYHESIDQLADTFFIDPDKNNPRAKHVYSKAGFAEAGDYVAEEGAFKGQATDLMVRRF